MTAIFLSVLGISISVGLMVIVLLLITPFLNKRYAIKWKYLIWILLAIRLLIPVNGTDGMPVADKLSQLGTGAARGSEERDSAVPEVMAEGMPASSSRIIVEIPAQLTEPITAQDAMQPGKSDAGITFLDIVIFVWITGILAYLSLHIISYLHYERQVMKLGNVMTDRCILSQISGLQRELHIRRNVQVIVYPGAESPMILGFLRPVLILPHEQYGSEELFFILKHELIHLKRGDVYIKLLFMTANAVHWMNPLIWIMQKEAAVDMELSCDERVTQGSEFTVRKAYTETLMSMFSERSSRKTVLSTQFYGGKEIMKKRFQNILNKNRKKNGIAILICAAILTAGLGTLVGCSVVEGDTDKEDIADQGVGNVQDQPSQEDLTDSPIKDSQDQADQIPVEGGSDDGAASEDTTTLTISKEGVEEQKRATLAAGDGYSIYLPDGEWQRSDTDTWTAMANDQVKLWVVHFEEDSKSAVDQRLSDEGYLNAQYKKRKQVDDLVYLVDLKGSQNDVWGIFCTYPADAEEGWGQELPVLTGTFALSAGTVGEAYQGPKDRQEISELVDAFAAAYFAGDADAIPPFLVSTYEGEIDTYESTGTVSDFTVKGLSDTDVKELKDGRCTVSLEFRDSSYEDMFLYLTIGLIREGDHWKIGSYGVEG